MNKSYTKGRRIEYLAKKILEAESFLVIRAAGSKGPIDIVAIRDKITRLIQIKSRNPSKKELERLRKIAGAHPGTFVEVWIWRKKGFQCKGIRNQ